MEEIEIDGEMYEAERCNKKDNDGIVRPYGLYDCAKCVFFYTDSYDETETRNCYKVSDVTNCRDDKNFTVFWKKKEVTMKEIEVNGNTYVAEHCNKIALNGTKQPDWYTCDKCAFDSTDNCEDVFNTNDRCKVNDKAIFWKKKEEAVENKAHPHSEAITQWASDMAKDMNIIWQFWGAGKKGYEDLTTPPSWSEGVKYRRKPIEDISVYVKIKIYNDELLFTLSDKDKADLKLVFTHDGKLKDAEKNIT